MYKKIQKDDKPLRSGFFSGRVSLFTVQLILLTVVILSAAVGGTYAYLTINTTPAVNNFTFGIPQVIINEPSVDPDNVAWGADTKPVTLSVPADAVGGVVRAAIIPMLLDADGNMTGVPTGTLTAPVDNKVVTGDITLHFKSGWETDWFFKDGIFYYKKVLETGQTTSLLLTGVSLTENTPEMTAKYQDIDVKIEVMADILQADPTALVLWGITVDVSGNVA